MRKGPYRWKDDALPCCGHIGPGAVRHPDGTFLLFSWGPANASGAVPCINGFPTTPGGELGPSGVRLHTSTTPHGPWAPVLNPFDGTDVLWRAVNPNPTPLVLANGTVVVLGGGLWVADHWKGPYLRRAGLRIPSSSNCSADPRAHRSSDPTGRRCNCSAAGCTGKSSYADRPVQCVRSRPSRNSALSTCRARAARSVTTCAACTPS